MIVAAALGFGALAASRGRARWLGIGAAVGMAHPLMGVAAAVGAAASSIGVRRAAGSGPGGLLLLCDHVALALRAGMTLEGALRASTPELDPALREEVGEILRAAHREGLGRALEHGAGSGRRLYRASARAVRTGAPLSAAVEALADQVRHEEHARRLAAARRLPVRLLLPLTLLILPGFVLLTVGPALIGSLARLEIGW